MTWCALALWRTGLALRWFEPQIAELRQRGIDVPYVRVVRDPAYDHPEHDHSREKGAKDDSGCLVLHEEPLVTDPDLRALCTVATLRFEPGPSAPDAEGRRWLEPGTHVYVTTDCSDAEQD